jgi:hypothetical protein
MKKLVCLFFVVLMCGAALWAQQGGVAFADKPAILTSIGQSADIEMIRVLLTRAGIPFKANSLLEANDLGSGDKTLILVIGGSSKGLGAAGISADDELKRAQVMVQKAKDLGMKIISLHIGGDARRGSLSDGFIKFAIPLSDYVIVVSEGDKDGMISNLTNQAKIPINKVDRISAVGTPLAAAFR